MIAFACLGFALLLVHGPRPSAEPAADQPAAVRSVRFLQLAATMASAGAALALLGSSRGLIAAAVLVPTAWLGIARLYAVPVRSEPTASLARTLDLVAAALRAGAPPGAAVIVAAPAADQPARDVLLRAGRALELGADADEAWREAAADPVLTQLATAARRSAASGARLALAFDQAAEDLRTRIGAAAAAKAHRASVLAVGPLGLCFLPAFVCLGIVPVLVGIASGLAPALR